jgi:Zn-dependent alcohol dehydrogenase
VDLPAVVALAAEGALSLADTVTRRYPLEQVNEAFNDLRAGHIRGRAVVHMGGNDE